MKIVVPLAGPDFERADGSVKAEQLVEGRPLLRQALESRPWWRDGTCGPGDLTVVLRETAASRAFAATFLAVHYPGCRTVFLAQYAQGAALSALAGVAAVAHCDEPLVVDLVDILYDVELPLAALFAADAGLGGLALVFGSDNPAYSYLRLEGGSAVEAAEKRVISNHASAGTYAFRSPALYMKALAGNLAQPERVTHAGLFFVCPVFNGVIEAGLRVAVREVTNVRDIKMEPAGNRSP